MTEKRRRDSDTNQENEQKAQQQRDNAHRATMNNHFNLLNAQRKAAADKERANVEANNKLSEDEKQLREQELAANKERVKEQVDKYNRFQRGGNRPEEEKSIMGAIEHTTSWDPESIAAWSLFTVIQFGFGLTIGWVLDYAVAEQEFQNAIEKDVAYIPKNGEFPPLHPLDKHGELDYSKVIHNADQIADPMERSATIIRNGYIPPPTVGKALAEQFVHFQDTVLSKKAIDGMHPFMREYATWKKNSLKPAGSDKEADDAYMARNMMRPGG